MSSGYDHDRIAALARSREHRRAVGGLWDEIASLGFNYLIAQGLRADMRLLDIACGALRIGVPLIDFLEPDHYFGIDISGEVLAAGYDVELLAAGLQDKLTRAHLVQSGLFEFGLVPAEEPFDMALAHSLFTHTPLNDVRLCLERLAGRMRPGATFHATFFMVADDQWADPVTHDPGGITTHPTSNPYHYRVADLHHAAAGLPWHVGEPTHWDHPRAQSMVVFTRLSPA